MSLNFFDTARPAFIWREAPATYGEGEFHIQNPMSGWIRLSYGCLHLDPEDPCDPISTTIVVQAGDELYARLIADAIANGTSVEAEGEAWLIDTVQPSRCYCAHDCCGHRHGRATAKHLTGAIFVAQIHEARNY